MRHTEHPRLLAAEKYNLNTTEALGERCEGGWAKRGRGKDFYTHPFVKNHLC